MVDFDDVANSKSRKGRQARQKGLAYERAIAGKLKKFFPHVKRHLEFQASEARGIDLDNTGPFAFQIKKCKSYVPVKTIEEIKPSDPLAFPALITAGDNQPAVVCLYLDDFLLLVEKGALNELF